MFIFYGVLRYGKANRSSRYGVCDACGSPGILNTYDTAQFFHLYWIPLIPIGHTKVIDACPHCEKCRIISPRKYRKLKAGNETRLVAGLRENPNDPDLVCEALGHWSSFNDQHNFEKMATLYQSRMAGNADVMKAIVVGYYRLGLFAQAAETARRLPESEPNRVKLIEEAEAHAEVEAADRGKSSNPVGIPIFLPYLVPLLIVLAILGSQFAEAHKNGKSREIWLVNGTLQSYSVEVDGTEYRLKKHAAKRIELPMGKHDVQITGTLLPAEPFSFEYDLPMVKRIADDKVLVLNPDGMAFLVMGHLPYISEGSSSNSDPRYEYYFGKKWHELPATDYVFRKSPENINMPSGQNVAYKTQLSLYEPSSYSDAANALIENGGSDQLIPFAEAALQLDPENMDASWMLGLILGTNGLESINFLREALTHRPILTEWHRFYQECLDDTEYDLIGEYDALIQAEPENPTLKYLRGRIEPDHEKARALFLASEKGEGCGGYGYYAAAYGQMCRLQYAEAVRYARKAMLNEGKAEQFDSVYTSACLATHDYTSLVELIRRKKTARPDDGELVAQEIRYLDLAGRHDEGKTAETIYLKSTAQWMDPAARKNWQNYFNAARAYAAGNIGLYLKELAAVIPEMAAYQQVLHEGNTQSAFDLLESEEVSNYSSYLTVYGNAMHLGQSDVATRALEKAMQILEARPDLHYFLCGENNPTPDALTEAELLPEDKLLIASTLGYLHPEQKAAYFELVKKCNYTPFFPQKLIEGWMEESR